ncbi:MAG: hypothetical protein UX15_C0041G0006 [Parcubacteria group bacterium GW2011_GWA1_45_7]|nr:MAG: hypothetical protein UX15_C0041G0006 [Parcubacteria group bacterium GW2011_GWA1_45_7]
MVNDVCFWFAPGRRRINQDAHLIAGDVLNQHEGKFFRRFFFQPRKLPGKRNLHSAPCFKCFTSLGTDNLDKSDIKECCFVNCGRCFSNAGADALG